MSDTSAQTVEAPPKRLPRKKAQVKKVKAARRPIDTGRTDQFGFRLGTLKAKAAAMYATKKGATLGETKAALHSTQFNVLTELEHKGYKVERVPVKGIGDREVTRYHVIVK